MREFFHGWRRKVGVAVLVIAGAIFGAWMRSRHHVDYVEIQTPITNCLLLSGNERLLVAPGKYRVRKKEIDDQEVTLGFYPVDSLERNSVHIAWDSRPVPMVQVTAAFQPTPRPTYRVMLDWLIGDGERRRAMLPYWALLLPITLLSAYLLLWKPQTRESEPVKKGASG